MNNLLIFIVFLSLSWSPAIFSSDLANPAAIQSTLEQIYHKYQSNTHQGQLANYIPELGKVDPRLFAIVIMTVDGKVYSVGDADTLFPLESVSKPFVYALALMDNGETLVNTHVGLNATGHAFNSIKAIDETQDHLQNPLVNAGALITSGLIKGDTPTDKWQRELRYFQNLSDDRPYLGMAVYRSEMATNQRNQAIAQLLSSYHLLTAPDDAVDRYTKACSLMVTAKQLAIMSATLANNGVNPITHKKIIPSPYVRAALSQMITNGLYENSGVWFYSVGLPAKSGVSGAMIAIVPGKMAIVVYSPLLDESGASVRGKQVIEDLSNTWHLHMLEAK